MSYGFAGNLKIFANTLQPADLASLADDLGPDKPAAAPIPKPENYDLLVVARLIVVGPELRHCFRMLSRIRDLAGQLTRANQHAGIAFSRRLIAQYLGRRAWSGSYNFA
jgi:hypothetical protein